MRTLLFLLVVLLTMLVVTALSGCAKVTVKTTNTPAGTDWDITYSTLFRAIEGVEAGYGSAEFSLGTAGSDAPISNELMACMLAPALCK